MSDLGVRAIKTYVCSISRGLLIRGPRGKDLRDGWTEIEWYMLDFEFFWAQVTIAGLLGQLAATASHRTLS